MSIVLKRLPKGNPKKFSVTFPSGKTVKFGAQGYSDYTIHGETDRKQRYIIRHGLRENWNKSGIETPGFWSRWILWNKKTIDESVRFTSKKFRIRIVYQRGKI